MLIQPVLATLLLEQPNTLALALVAVALAALLRRQTRAGLRGGAEADSKSAPRRRIARMAAPAALVIVVTIFLARSATAAAQAMLAILAGACVVWWVAGVYGRPRGGLTRLTRFLMAVLRVSAWLIVLALLGRPIWDRQEVTWHKPLLVALLDQSTSMAIEDMPTREGSRESRAAIVNAAIDDVPNALRRLEEYYELHHIGVGEKQEALGEWHLAPTSRLTALAAALDHAGEMRGRDGGPPLAVLLISDGAENVATRDDLLDAGRRLAARGTALLAVGVGPPPETVAAVELAPLNTPARVGQREQLPVVVDARITGCARRDVSVVLYWNNQLAAEERVAITEPDQRLRHTEIIVPPNVGVHRLTATVTPLVEDGAAASVSTIVDVTEAATRVLLLDGRPRSEIAFIYRALEGDPDLEVQRLVWFAPNVVDAEPPLWDEFDVIILGQVGPAMLTPDVQTRLAQAVRVGGSGLLLAGGGRLFNEGDYRGSTLADLSPTTFETFVMDSEFRPRFVPTERGLAHPILAGLGEPQPSPDQPDGATTWATLPRLGGCAYLGKRPKPLAEVLATADGRQALLVVHDVGRGRCAAAGWESTWSWALASDAGHELHRRLWRQMVRWLANRRPSPWVLTDRTQYAVDALNAGQAIKIRAGISGAPASNDPHDSTAKPTLHLRQLTADADPQAEAEPVSIPLEQRGGEWTATIAAADLRLPGRGSIDYALEFVAATEPQSAVTDVEAMAYPRIARTRFSVRRIDVERESPTSDLAALQQLARLTADHGGRYRDISGLRTMLVDLAARDVRRPIETTIRFDPASQRPWTMFLALVAALSVEWAIRRRHGLP